MKELFYYTIFAIVLYFVLTAIFNNFNLEQENFDSSLVPVSSIVTLAKVAQKLVNGNGTLIHPGNLKIGSNLITKGLLSTPSLTTTNTTINGTLNVSGLTPITDTLGGQSGNKNATISTIKIGSVGTSDIIANTSANNFKLSGTNANGANVQIYNNNLIVDKNLILNNTNDNTNRLIITTELLVDGDVNAPSIKENNNTLILPGIIIAFNGTTAPAGWALCDGTNGTPDLRGKFLRMDTLTKDISSPIPMKPGITTPELKGINYNTQQSIIFKHTFKDTKGSDFYKLERNMINQHTHSVTDNGHVHPVIGDKSSTKNGQPEVNGNMMTYWYSNTIFKLNSSDMNTSNSSTKIKLESTGNSANHNIQPPYYVANYIMKL